MEEWKVTLLSTFCSVLGSVVVAKMTGRKNTENDAVKMNRERQEKLYREVYKEAEKLRLDRSLVFDDDFRNTWIAYMPDVRLLASDETVEAFMAFGNFIHTYFEAYLKYYKKQDPHNDPNFCDEDGCSVFLPNEFTEDFEDEMRTYKYTHIPEQQAVNSVIDALCASMKNDLGITNTGGV